jgi:hypothetical protein
MRRTAFLWLPFSFAVAFLAIGIPFWRIPYNQFDLGHGELLPGAILLGVLTLLLIVAEAARARWVAIVMSLCVPAIDCVSIAHDTAIDPTSHNLAPFELVAAFILGAAFVVPGLVAGTLLRTLVRRQQAG